MVKKRLKREEFLNRKDLCEYKDLEYGVLILFFGKNKTKN